MRFYRRFIRINDELISSPRFTRKKDAESWYHEMRRKKQFERNGLPIPTDDDGIAFIEFARKFMLERKEKMPASTWHADEQRMRDYVLPLLSEIPIGNITVSNIFEVLNEIAKPGFRGEGEPAISPATVDRVKALLSAVFSRAMIEQPPIVKFNPVLGLKLARKKYGPKAPIVLPDSAVCDQFLENARKMSSLHYVISATFLMTGLRKQELIALKWSAIDFKQNKITVSEKYEQASNSFKSGTKRGENVQREFFMPKALSAALRAYKRELGQVDEFDFVFKLNGKHLMPRVVWQMVTSVAKATGPKVHVHGLRHTFGREFALKTGNIKALQSILGHSNSQTTDIYSHLSGSRLKPFSEAVSFGKSVKRSTKRRHSDTKKLRREAQNE